MKINDNVSFTYLKGAENSIDANGVLTKDYTTNAENYSGKVVDVRNIEDQPLAWENHPVWWSNRTVSKSSYVRARGR